MRRNSAKRYAIIFVDSGEKIFEDFERVEVSVPADESAFPLPGDLTCTSVRSDAEPSIFSSVRIGVSGLLEEDRLYAFELQLRNAFDYRTGEEREWALRTRMMK